MVERVPWKGSSPSPVSHSPDERFAAFGYLCPRAARKFRRTGLEDCDLRQVAAIGLLKASRRYDPSAGTPFEAYAWMMVIGELMHHVRDTERAIRIPRKLQTLERRRVRARETLTARLGHDPSDEQLASELGILPRDLVELHRAFETARPLDLEDAGSAFIADDALPVEDRVAVGMVLASLAAVERRTVVGTYVLGLSQTEIAQRLGISPKRVSRAHRSAVSAIREAIGC